MTKLAKVYNVSHTTILALLERRGIPRRPLTEACKRPNRLTREQRLTRIAQKRLDRIAAGLCASCGKAPPVTGRTQCQPCRGSQRERSKTFYLERMKKGECQYCGGHLEEGRYGLAFCLACNARIRKKQQERRDAGLCPICGKLAAPGIRLCLRCRASTRASYRKRREDVVAAYGGRCECCGETALEFLAIDHINGGGNRHRRKLGRSNIYGWLIRNKYPSGFRVLCHNCNQARSYYGQCPHERARNAAKPVVRK